MHTQNNRLRLSAIALIAIAIFAIPASLFGDDCGGTGTNPNKGKGPKIPRRHNLFKWHLDGRQLTVDFPDNENDVKAQLFSMEQCVWTSTITKDYPSAEIPDNLHGCFILTIQPANPDFQHQQEMIIL